VDSIGHGSRRLYEVALSTQYVGPVSSPVNLPAVRVVDAHSLAHRKAPKAAAACDAADLVDALTRLQNPTIKVAAVACDVSQSYVAAALRLSPVQRDDVRRGRRPLVSPKPVKALPAPVNAQAKLANLVTEIGTVDGVIEMLIKLDRASAA